MMMMMMMMIIVIMMIMMIVMIVMIMMMTMIIIMIMMVMIPAPVLSPNIFSNNIISDSNNVIATITSNRSPMC